MAWTYVVREINTPSLTTIRVAFELKKDGVSYCNDDIQFAPSELQGTNVEKLNSIKVMIALKCQPYLDTNTAANGLQQYVGAEVTL